MTNALRLVFALFLVLGAINVSCSAGETVGNPGTGNTTGNPTPGSAGTGAGNITGAAGTGSGNVTGRGGTGSGNITGAAGTSVTGAAGTQARGGTTGAAGTTVTGAAGTTVTGAAGTTGTGTAGTTGTSTACGASFEVTADGFAKAPAAGGGCWHGYAFAGGDAGSSITPMSFMTCGMPCMLKMMGTVGAATMANNYAGVAYVGFNLAQENGASTMTTVTPTGSGVTVTFSASTGTQPLRAQISGAGSAFWCYTIPAGSTSATIPYGMFNDACWGTTGVAYAKQPITNFELVVPGAETGPTMNVSVALTSLKENP